VAEAEHWAAEGGSGEWGDEGEWGGGGGDAWAEGENGGWGGEVDGSVLSGPSLALSHASSVWEECQDEGGKVFFYNVHTGESSWRDPRGSDDDSASLQRQTAVPSPTHRARPPSPRDGVSTRPPSPRDGGWEVAQDDDGTLYYFNAATGESTYERPDGAQPVDTVGDPAGSAGYDEAWAASGGAEWGESAVSPLTAPLGFGGDWEETDDGEGPYWYNNATGETSWVQPEF
jgi:hypothetical protein